jgi:SAM-dependent methyltransferase
MPIEWDYTAVAQSYLKRPPYAPVAIAALLRTTEAHDGMRACDVGAGTGNLTLPLATAGLHVVALEPSAAMRALGRSRVAAKANVHWVAALAEAIPLAAESCDLVTFGSSFNVVDPVRALHETARVLKPGGWFVCLWNHRRLDDPLQARIDAIVRGIVPTYAHGARREDQTPLIMGSGAFGPVVQIAGDVVHRVPVADCLEAWRSHLTLRRQAGKRLPEVLGAIGALLLGERCAELAVPYTTRVWLARRTLGSSREMPQDVQDRRPRR